MRTGGIVLDSEGKGAKRIHLACLFLNFHKAKRTRLTSRAYDCGIYPYAFTIWWKSLDSTTRGMLESWGALWMAAKYIKCTLMRNTDQIRKAICLHESIMGYRDKVFPSAAAAPLPQTDFADAGACTNIAPNVLLASGTLRK